MTVLETNLLSILSKRVWIHDASKRMEGVAFNSTGTIVGTALADGNEVDIYRLEKSRFGYNVHQLCRLDQGNCGIDYPHDLAFSLEGNDRLLAVAQRTNSIIVFEKNASGTYGPDSLFRIEGPQTLLDYSDGVAFVPQSDGVLAACSLYSNRVTFYALDHSSDNLRFHLEPCYLLESKYIVEPDGIAMSTNGDFMALANHSDCSAVIFQREATPDNSVAYHNEPVAVIRDQSIQYAHSVAFTPIYNHLIVTNAGANYVNVYACQNSGENSLWSSEPTQRLKLGNEDKFQTINSDNKMEGGGKGISVCPGLLALCRPETHLSIFNMDEDSNSISFNDDFGYLESLYPKRLASWENNESGGEYGGSAESPAWPVSVNVTGRVIWDLCDGTLTVGDIVCQLRSIYPNEGSLESDIYEMINMFRASDMIELDSGDISSAIYPK